jgi:hypothetical protein
MTWLDDAVARWGEPYAKPPEQDQRGDWPSEICGPDGVRLWGMGWRRGWVWFPELVNHGVSIDRCNVRGCDHGVMRAEHWVVRAWSHHGSTVTGIFTEAPNDDDVAVLTDAAWSCCQHRQPSSLPKDGAWATVDIHWDLSGRGGTDGNS